MTPRSYACECCGAPACVHVMHEVGKPGSARHLCLHCADGGDNRRDALESLNHGATLIGIGLLLLTLSMLADSLRLGQGHGFGSWQVMGLTVAIVVIASGSLTRVSSLCVVGWCFLLITLGADYVGLDGRPGFGIRQTVGLLIASTTIGAGIALGFSTPHRPAESAPWRPAGQGKDDAG